MHARQEMMNKALVRRAVSVVHLDAKMTKSKIVLCVPYDTRIHMLLRAMKQRFCAIEAFSSQAQLNLAGSEVTPWKRLFSLLLQ